MKMNNNYIASGVSSILKSDNLVSNDYKPDSNLNLNQTEVITRGTSDTGNTKEVWFYDLRTNMPSFGKTNPLSIKHFAAFEKAFKAENRHTVNDERFNVFTREQIVEKNNSLDLGLIRDDSTLDYDNLPDPIESGEKVIIQLKEAIDLMQSVVDELKSLENG